MLELIKYISGQSLAIDVDYGIHILNKISLDRQFKLDASYYKELKEQSAEIIAYNIDNFNKISIQNKDDIIAELSISGMMTLEDTLCAYGMQYYSKKLYELDALENVKAIYLRMNTGGGELQAGIELYNAISDITTPVFVHYHTLGSGGVWGTLPATKIYGQQNTSFIGSIGVFTVISSELIKELKKDIAIYPKTSKNKNKEIRALLKDDVQPFIKRLDYIDEQFMSLVKQHRDLLYDVEDTLSGHMFNSIEGKRRGLNDDILTKLEVFNRIKQYIKL